MRAIGHAGTWLLLAALSTVGSTTAWAVQVSIPASKDNTLFQLTSGEASNGAGEYLFTGRTKEALDRRAVIHFNIGAFIPAGSTINTASLQMRVSRVKTNTLRATTLHRLLADWGEGTSNAGQNEGQGAPPTTNDATWNNRFDPATPWTTPGGDFDGTATATVLISVTGAYAWSGVSVVADVQSWLDTPSSNFGWLIRGDETTTETTKRLDSKENTNAANRPVLIVDYTPSGEPTGACCYSGTCGVMTAAQCASLSGTYRGDGSSCTPDPCGGGGSPDSLVAQASADNTLYEDAAGSLSNGLGTKMILSRSNQTSLLRRGIVRFDLSAIPVGATVQSATLRLHNAQGGTNTADVTVHRAIASWGEGTSVATGSEEAGAPSTTNDATWLHRFYPSPSWATPGGDYVATASATTSMANEGLYLWSSAALTADVQGWVNDPATNHGWVVRGRETTGGNATKRLESRQSATVVARPALLVLYTPPPPEPTGACCLSNGSCDTLTMAQCAAASGVYQGDGTVCTPYPCTLELTPYVDPLPRPAVATPVSGTLGGAADYVIPIREFAQQLHRDLPPTRVWGYGGTYPGPTIEATTGAPIQVTWWNDLRDSQGALRTTHYLPVDLCLHGPDTEGPTPRVVTHLHGGHVPAASDGHPDSTFLPGQQVVYPYPNDQPAGTLWYHDHALGITRLNVMMGLAGFYLIRDPVENALGLPAGEYEIPLAIQDRSFNPDGSLLYPEMWMEHFAGDKMLVNGKVWPYLQVKQGKYRFRLLNGCNSRFLRLSLSNGAPFTVIGTELGLLPAPVVRETLLISNGERVDVVIDFASYPAGTQIVLANDAPHPFPGAPGEGVIPNVMRFDVIASSGHTAPIPASLRPVQPIDTTEAVVTRDFVLRKGADPCTGGMWMINDLHWDDITEYPVLGSTEIWRFVNDSGISHPMHMHLVQFQVVDRQPFTRVGGQITPTGPPVPPSADQAGWKDTAPVAPNEILRVIARFEDYAGLYPYHCHILEHEDHEMMRQFQSVQPPIVSVRDSSVTEGGGTASFAVTLSAAVPVPVRVLTTTEDGTALAGPDYTAVSDTLDFAPGQTIHLFSVPILQDAEIEGNETFAIRLTWRLNCLAGDTVATGTVLDDDGPVGVTPDVPAISYLGPPAPNPFADRVVIQWGMSETGTAEILLFDVQGRRIRRLVRGSEAAGHKRSSWDGRDDAGRVVPAGIYLVRLRAGDRVFRGAVLRLP
jgi:spore coat protein A